MICQIEPYETLPQPPRKSPTCVNCKWWEKGKQFGHCNSWQKTGDFKKMSVGCKKGCGMDDPLEVLTILTKPTFWCNEWERKK